MPEAESSVEVYHLVGNLHLGAEFLRLVVGARHQRQAADACRKAEIVFDPGGSSGLAAEGAAVQHERGKSLGRRIHRRREAGRSRADDRDVVELRRVHRFDEADAAGEFVLARIAQQLPVRTQHNRQFLGRDMEALD